MRLTGFVKIAGLAGLLLAAQPALANLPGGGTGSGPAVTLVNNGNGTVTMANGIVSILCTTASATLNQINYTYNNGSGPVTNLLLSGGKDGGEFYWELGGFSSGNFTYSSVANNGNYAEMDLLSTSATNGALDIHYSMLRGSPGFYVTAIWSHRAGDPAMGMGETRDNIYLNPEFTWNSIDAPRNFQYNLGGAGGGGTGGAVAVLGAPQEVTLWTNGIAAGHYEDKYKYTADFGTERVWGWSSVNNPAAGFTGQNIGIWYVLASAEFYNGGPMKPELMDAPMVNMLNGGHYELGSDSQWGAGETWSRVSGPYFIYCNNITNTVTNTFQAVQELYGDALAQAAAEQSAWPYSWFVNAGYSPASQRGAVSGQLVINDIYNPNATASNLWVGVVQQPVTVDGVYDFQQWMKPYQFWVKTDANGNFTIPNVIAGNNYTLYAFGQGAAGTFFSQNQNGGNPPLLYNLPATPFSVTITAGATNRLDPVTWTPARVGPTVFEIGYPDRTARKFRHGEDWWVGDIGPGPANPLPIWTKFLEYPFDFPKGPNYIVGQSRWTTDWNFIQPVVTDLQGNYNGSTSTITFNLAGAPTNGAIASLYLGLCSDYAGPLIVSVNGSNLGSTAGVTATPSTESSTGFFPSYDISDTSIREGINAAFSDERLTFSAGLLHAGQNTITINMRKGGYFADHAMYDYLRLELTGYVPPPTAAVAAYAGNNAALVCWPVVPGATSYNLLRSTTPGSNYVLAAGQIIGPVCGSGWNNATYLDTNVINGSTYYYMVQSVNPVSTSTNSTASPGVTPSAGLAASAPAAPTGLTVTANGHQSVTLSWSAPVGANFYTVYRSTLFNNLGGVSNVLGTIVLNNNVTGTTYTDTSPTDGSIYNYCVTATSAGGTSSNSTSTVAVPLPSPPSAAPGSFSGRFVSSNLVLTWSPVSGAVGYIIRRATSFAGPYAYVMSITETNYTDPGLNTNSTYFYQVVAVNAGGVSTDATVTVLGPPIAPGLAAIAGNTQVSLTWTPVTAATNYMLQSSTASGGTYATIANTTNTSFLNSNLLNGTTYYYVVYSQGPNGTSPLSVSASATPSLAAGGIYWTNTLTASAQSWNVNANWINGGGFPNATQAVAIVNSPVAANQTIDLNQAVILGSLSLGTSGSAFTLAANGGTLAFDNTPVPAALLELPASKGDTIAAPLVINESLLVTNASPNPLLVSGGISGSNLVLNGNVSLSGTNTYTGGTILNGGTLIFNVGSAIPVTGVLTLANTGVVTVVTANSLPNVLVKGTNIITGNGNSGTGIATLDDEGLLTLQVNGGSKVFDLTDPMTGPGALTLGNPSAMTLRFNGTSGDGNALFNLGTPANFASVRSPPFAIALGGLAGGSATTLQGSSSYNNAVTFTLGGAGVDAEFDGVIVNGGYSSNPAVAVVKTGANTQTFTGANTYGGGTTINGGTLRINNSSGSGTGTGAITVNSGGGLAGNGFITGAVTVNSGGALVPSGLPGVLTLSNNLILTGGSGTFLQVQAAPATNNSVNVSGLLTEGGTLNVTVSNATTFAAGDRFKLFNAANYTGSFAGFNLPTMATHMNWNTSRLNVDGSLWVVSALPPNIAQVSPAGTNLVFNGANGTPNWTYYVLMSTNLALPAAQWTRLATNPFDSNGSFSFTNAVNAGLPEMFYRVQSQ
jgi:autotransporter-associated beta strand protein